MKPKSARRFLKAHEMHLAKHNMWCRYGRPALRFKQPESFLKQVRECTRILLAEEVS